jgi:hypothetical protein
MIYSRINLSKTYYKKDILDWEILKEPDPSVLNNIYITYCRHKKFESVMPIFDSEYFDCDVIGYFHENDLVAFSLIRVYDTENIEAIQFAWDYNNPELRTGVESLKVECAIYKELGYKYYYLGDAAEYKQIDGYEELGPA